MPAQWGMTAPWGSGPVIGWLVVGGVNWIAQNATYDGTNWNRGDITLPARAVRYNTDGSFDQLYAAAGANPIAWTVQLSVSATGVISNLGPITGIGPLSGPRPWIDVYPSGDTTGVMDLANINAAIAKAGLWSGSGGLPGIVQLSDGTFYVNNTIAFGSRNVWLRGQGQAATLILLTAGANADVVSIGTTTPLSSYGQTISDLTIHGNGAGQTTAGNGITTLAGCQEALISRVRIINTFAYGIRNNGGNKNVVNCNIEGWGRGAAAAGVSHEAGATGTVTGCWLSSASPVSGSAGISVNSTSLVQISVCNIQVDGANQININNSSQVTVVGCGLGGGPTTTIIAGVQITGASHHCSVSGGFVQAFTTAAVVITSSGANTSNTVSGVACAAAAAGSQWGMVEGAGSGNANNVFSGNPLSGTFTTAAISMTGAGSRAVNNPGFNPVGVVTVAVPASGTAIALANYDRSFYITTAVGGLTMAIQGGPSIVIPASSFGTVRVPAGQTVTPTYTNAPTWVVEGE